METLIHTNENGVSIIEVKDSNGNILCYKVVDSDGNILRTCSSLDEAHDFIYSMIPPAYMSM